MAGTVAASRIKTGHIENIPTVLESIFSYVGAKNQDGLPCHVRQDGIELHEIFTSF